MGLSGPRRFLAQLDIAELKDGPDWLPTQGCLMAFYDPDRHGDRDVVSILFQPEAPKAPVVEGAEPAGRHIEFRRYVSLPSPEWLDVDMSARADLTALPEAAEVEAALPPQDGPQHRLGGYPDEIQDECMRLTCERMHRGLAPYGDDVEITPAMERASRAWRLLLQIDTDPELEFEFGDGGRLYVFVRADHGRVGDFSRPVALWQTY